jgi:hypothetical protein
MSEKLYEACTRRRPLPCSSSYIFLRRLIQLVGHIYLISCNILVLGMHGETGFQQFGARPPLQFYSMGNQEEGFFIAEGLGKVTPYHPCYSS